MIALQLQTFNENGGDEWASATKSFPKFPNVLQYDLLVTTFSPDGRVLEVEYASKALDNGGTVVGIKCKDGVVLGVEKLISSKMLLEGSNRRIHAVDPHAGMAMAGLVSDGRQIVTRTCSEAAGYKSSYPLETYASVLQNMPICAHSIDG